MPRIAGVDIPAEKKTNIALTYIFGIGRSNVKKIIKESSVDPNKRAHLLTTEEISRLQHVIERINTEGELRKQIRENIERLKRIGSYRGSRHAAGLPARGQRTRTNARTKRGKRKTVGALEKKEAQKLEDAKKEKPAE
ncbi:MAG: 30S ribosomal protein S13 [Candidatus Chisholmbacteria bacterium]|nr:30S ribosomal protein S13 [Candidatus Chisholmbacteria bacterium]